MRNPTEHQAIFNTAYRLFAAHPEYYKMASLILYFKKLHQDKEAFESLYNYLLLSGVTCNKN